MICRKKRSWPSSSSTSRSAVSNERDIFLATKNAGKRAEFDALFAGTPFAPRVFADYRDPVEGESSYTDNAALKAVALRDQLAAAGIRAAVLADDSGLEIHALAGRPGVVTADYGGAGLSWSERRRYVLEELASTGSPDRRARFVCYLHFISAGGRRSTAFGTVEGTIADHDCGASGFSFDPIFFYEPAGRTFAELAAVEKNAVSHRARALANLLATITAS